MFLIYCFLKYHRLNNYFKCQDCASLNHVMHGSFEFKYGAVIRGALYELCSNAIHLPNSDSVCKEVNCLYVFGKKYNRNPISFFLLC